MKILVNECDSGTNYLRYPRYHCTWIKWVGGLVTGGWGEIRNEELNKLYPSLSITGWYDPGGCAGLVFRTHGKDNRCIQTVLLDSWKVERKGPFAKTCHKGREVLKWIIWEECEGVAWMRMVWWWDVLNMVQGFWIYKGKENFMASWAAVVFKGLCFMECTLQFAVTFHF